MKKIIILIVPIILLSGCERTTISKYSDEVDMEDFYIYVDKATCLEYYVSNGMYNRGNVYPRYNQNGTIKANKQCLEENK